MASERRRRRIEEVAREQMSDILLREAEWPEGMMVTVTRVAASDDLEHATISVSVFPEGASETVLRELQKRIGELQRLFNRSMRMRPVPKLRFVPETEVGGADRIEAELYKLKHRRDKQ